VKRELPLIALIAHGLLWAGPAAAEDPADTLDPAQVVRSARDTSRIAGDVGAQVDGRTALNIVAGVGNAQANVASIAVGAGESHSSASQSVAARVDPRDAVADIGGNVLASGRGLTSINQVAGAANAQANLVAIGVSAGVELVQSIDVALLADVAAGEPLPADALDSTQPASTREARIGGAAFQGPQGVLQINQTAGVGNASANAIVLQIPGGAP
jgi:hypothetical protein